MVKINLKEGTELEFDMIIEGNMTKLDSLGLCIQEDDFELKLPCTFANSKIICKVPILEGIVLPGEKNITLEVVIDGKVYKPFEQTVEFEKPLSIKTNLAMVEESSRKPSMSMVSMSVKKAAKIEEKQVHKDPEPAVQNPAKHSLQMIKRRVDDLLEKVGDSRISAKAALREASIKVSQDKAADKMMRVWGLMLKDNGIMLEHTNSDREALLCLQALDGMLAKLLK